MFIENQIKATRQNTCRRLRNSCPKVEERHKTLYETAESTVDNGEILDTDIHFVCLGKNGKHNKNISAPSTLPKTIVRQIFHAESRHHIRTKNCRTESAAFSVVWSEHHTPNQIRLTEYKGLSNSIWRGCAIPD
jgi:hypothetical protein